MKKSIRNILKEFKDEDQTVQIFLKDVFAIEFEKLNSNNPQWRSELTDVIDAIIEKQVNKKSQ
jgi:hypothetical protein|tara:strand:+ start:438 stop:626 length:189 start_codon:yes stop_codon:yes gene_type:complete